MTPHQRRYVGAIWLVVVLAMGAALSSGWGALAFGAGSAAVMVAAGRRRIQRGSSARNSTRAF